MSNFVRRLLGFCIRWRGVGIRPLFRVLWGVRVPALVAASVGGILRAEASAQDKDWSNWQDLIEAIANSPILNGAEGISIIAGVVYFIAQGRAEGRKRANLEDWDAIEQAAGKPSSSSRKQAIEDLNQAGVSLESQDFSDVTDFTDIELPGANLQNAKLQRTVLRRANLQRASLELAVLEGARLEKACLEKACLFGAELKGADLGGANLKNADFEDADLRAVDFFFADLKGTNLKNANLEGANFRGAINLSPAQIYQAKNWELATYEEAFLEKLKPHNSLE